MKSKKTKTESKIFSVVLLLVALIAGIFFIGQGITGQMVLVEEEAVKTSFSFLGIALIFCALTSLIYLSKKKK